jgi:hypothetical protein
MLLVTALLLGFLASTADNSRYEVLTATYDGPTTFQIREGETAELVSSVSSIKNGTVQMSFVRDRGGGGAWGLGIPVTGPATITATASRDNIGTMVIRITAESSDENRTPNLTSGMSQIYVTLESSTNQVYVTLERSTNLAYVTLESSTNLLDWVEAKNGIYGSADTARFFRIRTKVLASH